MLFGSYSVNHPKNNKPNEGSLVRQNRGIENGISINQQHKPQSERYKIIPTHG
jgi:hypothetical protein